MDHAELDAFRRQLLALRAELQNLEETAKDSTRPVELDQTSVGRVSRMEALQAQQMAQESSRRRRQQLERIEGALRRIEGDEFGECFVCGGVIDRRRLLIDPTYTRCIKCVAA